MNTATNQMVILDDEASYAFHLMEYLNQYQLQPEISVYTDCDTFLTHADPKLTILLIVAESLYGDWIAKAGFTSVLVLNESEQYLSEEIPSTSKFQAMDHLGEVIVKQCEASGKPVVSSVRHRARSKRIGFFTPLSRCLQTSLSIAMGEILAENSQTLYLNFESFSGMDAWLSESFEGTISDLLYYNDCAPDRFALRLKELAVPVGNLRMIPPIERFSELRNVTGEEWKDLLTTMDQVAEYEYILLDLSEAVENLPELMRSCDRIYTICREDAMSQRKLTHYEEVLKAMHYEDVYGLTKKLTLPVFRTLPARIFDLSYGALGEYVRELLREDPIFKEDRTVNEVGEKLRTERILEARGN